MKGFIVTDDNEYREHRSIHVRMLRGRRAALALAKKLAAKAPISTTIHVTEFDANGYPVAESFFPAHAARGAE